METLAPGTRPPASGSGPAAPARPLTSRLAAVDIVRGAVMVLMAIDHVRVFAGVPAGGPTPAIFFTRWITHFCAPAFVFLAGTSAFLHGARLGNRRALSRWLVTRGVWLVVLELTFFRLAWTFNTDVAHYMLAGVIWMLGWCMVLMGGLVRLPIAASAVLAIAIVAGHNLSNVIGGQAVQTLLAGRFGWLWRILYFGGGLSVGGAAEPNFFVLYSIVPWIGVMLAGYTFGAVLRREPRERRRLCLQIGLGAVALFVLLRASGIYGDPRPWSTSAPWLAFLNTTKYPASLQFLLMTLGPVIALMPALENAHGRLAQWLTVFGRVPMFYYLLHIPLIHTAAVLISLVRTPSATGWLFGNHPVAPPPVPDGYMWSLGLLYLVFVLCVMMLYFPCRWFAELKAGRHDGWLSYL